MNTKLGRYHVRPLIAIVTIYLILLLGPIAAFDIPTIVARSQESPDQLIQFLIIGVANGAILSIIALGYTMVYGIIELINFAHGDVYMIGVFTALTTLSLTGALKSDNPAHIVGGLVIALVVAIAVCATLNATIERLAYKRLRKAPRLAPLISAIGMSFIVENIGLIWAAQSWLVPSFGTTGGGAQKEFPDLLSRVFNNMGMDPKLLANTGWGLRFTISRNDLVNNLGVVTAAGLVAWLGQGWPDLVVGTLVAALFLHTSFEVLRTALRQVRAPATASIGCASGGR